MFQNFIDQLIRWISKQWLWICPYFALAICSGRRRESNESFGLLWNHPFSWLMFQVVQVKYLSYSWVEIFQLHWHSHVWWQPQGINQHSIHIPWISHQYSTITTKNHHFCWLSPLRKPRWRHLCGASWCKDMVLSQCLLPLCLGCWQVASCFLAAWGWPFCVVCKVQS